MSRVDNPKNVSIPSHDEIMIMLLGAENNKPIPSLTHFAAEMFLVNNYFDGKIVPFKSWFLENEKGLLYNIISANREHEEDVL